MCVCSGYASKSVPHQYRYSVQAVIVGLRNVSICLALRFEPELGKSSVVTLSL